MKVLVLTLWFILAISQLGDSHGSGLKLGLLKSSRGHKSPSSRDSPTPKNNRGKNHGLKSHLPAHSNGRKKVPNYSSPPNTSTPPIVISPNLPPNTTSPSRPSGLQVGFYKGMCPNKQVDIEATISKKVQEHFLRDPTILAALLRMQFHDCFVHGCDASILIDGPSTEKTAGPNLSVRGYKLIDALKSIAEKDCPDVVSCADIIVIATKEAMKMMGGGGLEFQVETGRRDGVISRAEDVNLPSPLLTVSQTISSFAAKGFTAEDMVILLGGHTVGISHCAFFEGRLHQGTTQFDPLMDPSLRQQLLPTCPQGASSNNFTFLDQNPESSNKLDNSFFDQILNQRGILPIDQALARDPQTIGFVQRFAQSASLFNTNFASAMVKLQALDVLTGDQGQIRKICSRIN